MEKNIHVKMLTVISIICFLVIQWVKPEITIFANIGQTVSITILIWGLYRKWLWKFNVFSNYPKLKKCYKGSFISDYDKKNRDVTIKIKQTLTSINVYYETQESFSKSISSQIYKDNFSYIIGYLYLNEPDQKIRNRSQIHYGYIQLVIDGENLKGKYFTDRKTAGEIVLKPHYSATD